MGKINQFEITLANEEFYGGQLLEGQVIVDVKQEINLSGIKLNIKGDAKVDWSEDTSLELEMKHYLAVETYIDDVIDLFEKFACKPSVKPGRHVYPFQYKLPAGIPASYKCKVNRIRYIITGTIEQPWSFHTKTEKTFTVLNLLDLTKEPTAMDSAQVHGEKMVSSPFSKPGTILADFKLIRRGYVMGEAIPIYCTITNSSSMTMAKSFVELKMTVIHSAQKKRVIKRVVSKITHGPISPGTADVWDGDMLPVPPDLCPSNLEGCGIIDIIYSVRLRVVPKGLGSDLKVEPITILLGSTPSQLAARRQSYLPPISDSSNANREESVPSTYDVSPTRSESNAECGVGNDYDVEDDERMKNQPEHTTYL